MIVNGADWAFNNPDPAGLYAAGKRFGMRYVGAGTADKLLTTAERDRLWAAGLSIVLLCEGAEGDVFAGRGMGHQHATMARTHARRLGFPDHRPIIYAADKDVTDANIGAAVDYFRGVGEVDPVTSIGVYGDIDIMGRLHDAGLATVFFQSAAMFWSHGMVYPHNTIRQMRNGVRLAGGEVDLCEAYADDFGQWPIHQINREDDMRYFTFNNLPDCPTALGDRVVRTDGLGRFWVLPDSWQYSDPAIVGVSAVAIADAAGAHGALPAGTTFAVAFAEMTGGCSYADGAKHGVADWLGVAGGAVPEHKHDLGASGSVSVSGSTGPAITN